MKKKMWTILSIVLVFGAGFVVIFGNPTIDILKYKDEKVTIVGIKKENIELSISELKSMKLKTKKAKSSDEKTIKVKATGPLLNTVLNKYGTKQEDYKKIKVYDKDGNNVTMDNKFLRENNIILAFGIDGEPLPKKSMPLRIIVPKSPSSYWIDKVERIELIK